MERRIKEILVDIAEKTYGEPPKPFKIEIYPEERKTFHGDYCPQTKTIRIFNLSRPIDHIVSTTIHELAHHIDYSKYGSSGHNKRFYGIFRELLKTSIELGYVDYNSVKNKKDSLDIQQMEKYYGELVAYYNEEKDENKNKYIIKVFKSFNIKNYLYNNGFKYNSIEKSWDKNVTSEEIEDIKQQILKEDPNVKIEIKKFNDMSMDVYYYILVSKNTYEHKEELSKNGYFWKGYNEKSNSWVKKIKTENLKKEKAFLSSLGLEYKIKH